MTNKIKSLERKYPEFLKETSSLSEKNSSLSVSSSVSASLDFQSVIKASQSISSEIVIEKLFEKMLHITIESAGAQKAVFIEKVKEHWQITASLIHENDVEIFKMRNLPLKDFKEVPESVINTSMRSKEPLIIDNPKEDIRFSADPYILEAGAKSILCLPIIHQDKLIGLIYLENSLTAGAFTTDRITVLQTLTAQIAISLENARHLEHTEILYKATERFVPSPFLKLLKKDHIENVKLGDSVQIEVTVLFTDIRGYTTITEKQTPEEAFSFINAYLKVMAPIIRAHHGFINHYEGDGIMALFPESADDAVKAVLSLQKALVNFNEEQTKRGVQQFRVGYGLNSGNCNVRNHWRRGANGC